MTQSPKLYKMLFNVRAMDETYSAMPVRIIKTVAELDDIPVVIATTDATGGYLRRVEGDGVGIILSSRVEGLCQRIADTCAVILVDVPVDLANPIEGTSILDKLRAEAWNSGTEHRACTPEGGKLDKMLSASRVPIFGRGFVHRYGSHSFDPMLQSSAKRPACFRSVRAGFFDQPSRPFSSYFDGSSSVEEDLQRWLRYFSERARLDSTIRSILDRD